MSAGQPDIEKMKRDNGAEFKTIDPAGRRDDEADHPANGAKACPEGALRQGAYDRGGR
jgi:hypothetical protein